jgi:hypothetical protein
MKIKIKESQYNNLNEAVGVPSNIVAVAQQLFDKIISEINPNDDIKSFIKKKIILKGNFQINDYKFKTIKVTFNVDDINDYHSSTGDELPRIALQGMTHHGKVEMNAKFNYEANQNMNKVELSISFLVDDDVTTQEVIDELNKERTVVVSSLAHELKHAYDEYADPIIKTHKRVDYNIGSQKKFGNIPPLNQLLSYMYFAHTTENLVRATELYAALEESGITKKEFYKFLTSHRVYENYRTGANLTYEKLREDLKSIIPQIKETFDDNDIDYPEDATDEEMVDITLQKFYKILLQWKGTSMRDFLSNNFGEAMFGFKGEKQKYFDKYINNIVRFGGDYEKFFKYEINQIRNICYKMTKKLSKLYSLIKDKNPQQ